MTAEQVFKFYRAYKFFYVPGGYNDLERYASIKCPKLIDQRDRMFYYRISQRLSDAAVHALFTIGFFHNPRAHVSALATPDAFGAALAFASRAENGETLLQHELYELRKTLQSPESDIDAWLYGESDNDRRALMPECVQQIISEELPIDLACLLLLIPQKDLHFDWFNDMELMSADDMSLGPAPWIERLCKADQLLRLQRPTWRLDSRRIAQEFWHSFTLPSLAPVALTPAEPTLF